MTIFIIIGAVILFLLVFAMMDAKNIIKGICPKCSNKIGLRKGVGCCSHCGEPLQTEGTQFVPIGQNFVSDNFSFSISMGKLKDPKQWQTTWAGRCCICGNAATKTKTENVKTIRGSAGAVLGPQVNMTDTTKYEVGYCNVHNDGFKFIYPPGFGNAKRAEQCYLYFRSADFYREFVNQNAIRS